MEHWSVSQNRPLLCLSRRGQETVWVWHGGFIPRYNSQGQRKITEQFIKTRPVILVDPMAERGVLCRPTAWFQNPNVYVWNFVFKTQQSQWQLRGRQRQLSHINFVHLSLKTVPCFFFLFFSAYWNDEISSYSSKFGVRAWIIY